MIKIKRLEEMMERDRKKEVLYILIFFTCVVFGILICCGTLTSGIHLVDDHEFWRFKNRMELDHKSIAEVIKWKSLADSSWRFRPLYYPIRVLLTVVFGTNLFALSVLKGIEVVLTCVLVYFVARKLKCSIFYSIIAVLVVLVGPQSAIWWKLGPQELTGTWVFALGLLCLFKWKESRKIVYHIAALLCFIFISLYKESFIALLPAVMLMYLYLSMKGREITWKSFWGAVRENIFSELILGITILIEAYIIIFVVGTNESEYIGVNPDLGIWFYVKTFLNNFRLRLRIGQYACFVLALLVIFRKKTVEIIRETGWQLLMACAIIVPQFLVYLQSGLEERYIIPWVYGVAYYFIIVLSRHKSLEGIIKKCYNIAIAALLVFNFILVFYEGSYFAYRGRGITRMFEVVTQTATEETKVLTAFAPYDESYHTSVAVLRAAGIENVYIYEDECVNWYKDDEVVSFDEIDIILMYNEKDRHYLYEQDLDLSDFEVTEYNTVCVAVRK